MTLAKDTLEQLSQDPETHWLARDREIGEWLYDNDLAVSRAEGQANLLLKQLGLRFGPPSAATRAYVESATSEQLDVWAERVLTAQSLEEVLCSRRSRSDAERSQLAAEDPIMTVSKEDYEAEYWARERAIGEVFYQMDLLAAYEEGELAGAAKVLLEHLGLRFGPPPAAIRARVETATIDQIYTWIERVLTAQTIDEVVAP